MRTGAIDAVIVGADRITGDAVFNKIGTYMHAVCARYHGIPFYVAAPLSTFDATRMKNARGNHRGAGTRGTRGDRRPDHDPYGVPVKNYAFDDATPRNLVSAIITEKGVILAARGYRRTLI